jgi:hypothetical protein
MFSRTRRAKLEQHSTGVAHQAATDVSPSKIGFTQSECASPTNNGINADESQNFIAPPHVLQVMPLVLPHLCHVDAAMTGNRQEETFSRRSRARVVRAEPYRHLPVIHCDVCVLFWQMDFLCQLTEFPRLPLPLTDIHLPMFLVQKLKPLE